MSKLGNIIHPLLRHAGFELKPISNPPSRRSMRALKKSYPDVTEREWAIFLNVQPFTMTSLERIVANIRAIDYVVANNIPGDIVECGVWRGGSMMAMALALGDERRTVWMYDTYSGMTAPTRDDVDNVGNTAIALIQEGHEMVIACAQLEDVNRNMQATGYPMANVNFVQGPVEQTIPKSVPGRIAVLRLDTDWYESTRHELQHLYPLLSPGGVLILDDYGHWEGSKKAVDEYFQGRLFLHRIDYCGRSAIKP